MKRLCRWFGCSFITTIDNSSFPGTLYKTCRRCGQVAPGLHAYGPGVVPPLDVPVVPYPREVNSAAIEEYINRRLPELYRDELKKSLPAEMADIMADAMIECLDS